MKFEHSNKGRLVFCVFPVESECWSYLSVFNLIVVFISYRKSGIIVEPESLIDHINMGINLPRYGITKKNPPIIDCVYS